MMDPPHTPPILPLTTALLQRARGGDADALDQLARAVWPDLRRWALLELGDPASADDACQEALVRLLRHVARLDADRPLEGWLRTVVRSCCRDLRRRQRRAAAPPEAIHPDRRVDLERRVDLNRTARAAVHAFEALTPRQRQALDLVDRQGLSSAEAARVLGVADATVRALLHQGRRALRSSLLDPAEIRSLLRDA